MIGRFVARFVGFVLLLIGCITLLVAGAAWLWSARFQSVYMPTLPPIETSTGGHPAIPAPRPRQGHPIGRLEIPRLGLQSVVVEGDDSVALLLGVGHLSDTPLPWHNGNSVLAAHRDTFFRPLAGIREDDVIKFVTADAEIEYVVRETRIVKPTAVEVLAPTEAATLTLITCYPFNYIGPSPSRFIVRAERRMGSELLELQSKADLAQQP